MAPLLRIKNLSKQYFVGRLQQRHATFREALGRLLSSGWRRAGGKASAAAPNDAFWALRDVSFDVEPGEVLGIVGRNGAGKSTLLKLLSRITEPTEGWAEIRGRMGSLLEVGTGFHPELTGRENVFLNGAILGMHRREIKKKFDEIVAFAEVAQFLDTAVKHYSSGMYMRLAFAVAAHLETEILLVDEVLAVGDANFQRKCLNKMEAVGQEGRTVLFVSHNLASLRALCKRGILLEAGQVVLDGPIDEVLQRYARRLHASNSLALANQQDRRNRTSGEVQFVQVSVHDEMGKEQTTFRTGETVRFTVRYRCEKRVEGLGVGLTLRSAVTRDNLMTFREILCHDPLECGMEGETTLEFPDFPLRPGDYSLYMLLSRPDFSVHYDVIDDNVSLPWLTITGEDKYLGPNSGYFRLKGRLLTSQQIADDSARRRSA